jgi:hypothetical protein
MSPKQGSHLKSYVRSVKIRVVAQVLSDPLVEEIFIDTQELRLQRHL